MLIDKKGQPKCQAYTMIQPVTYRHSPKLLASGHWKAEWTETGSADNRRATMGEIGEEMSRLELVNRQKPSNERYAQNDSAKQERDGAVIKKVCEIFEPE